MEGYGVPPAYLEVRNGPLAGMSFPLQGTSITVGRKEDNDIVIPDPMVSGHHARIDLGPGAVTLTDLGSSNGTIVNGMPVQSHLLREGDIVFLGSTELAFRAGSPAYQTPAASPLFPPPAEKGSKRLPVIIGCIIGACVIIAGLVVLLFVLKGKEAAKDVTPPEVEITKPAGGMRYELPIAPGAAVAVEIEIKASDDRKLNKLELYLDGEKVTVFGRDDKSPYKYVFNAAQPRDYSVYATAYDEAGNSADSDPVAFTVWLDTAKKAAVESYVAQLDACVMEFNQYRSGLNGLVSKGRGLKQNVDPILDSQKWYEGWTEVYQGTETVSNGLSSLMAKAGAMSPPGEFATVHASFAEAAAALKRASDYANQWAYSSGLMMPSADSYLAQYNQQWQACDGHRARFNALYEEVCLALLGRPPYARF